MLKGKLEDEAREKEMWREKFEETVKLVSKTPLIINN